MATVPRIVLPVIVPPNVASFVSPAMVTFLLKLDRQRLFALVCRCGHRPGPGRRARTLSACSRGAYLDRATVDEDLRHARVAIEHAGATHERQVGDLAHLDRPDTVVRTED